MVVIARNREDPGRRSQLGECPPKPVQITTHRVRTGEVIAGQEYQVGTLAIYCPDRLFQPMQAALATSEHGGLGLALVGRMASTMGGRVRYAGDPDRGARFVVTLPGRSDAKDPPAAD